MTFTQPGKEVLIKSIIQAIPNHIMQCYHLPDSICDEITSLVRNFWWGKSCDSKTVYWKSWKEVCRPKGHGGMGFQDLKARNLSMLAKQGWRILTTPESLLAKVFKSRYFRDEDFMQASLGSRPSYIWRSILEGRSLLQLGIRYQIGSGQNISVWNDPWIPLPYTFRPSTVNKFKWPHANVSDLLMPDINEWNQALLEQLFLPYEVQAILQIPLCVQSVQDQIMWHHSSNGQFTVKSGYVTYKTHQDSFLGSASDGSANSKKSVWNMLWTWPVLPKIRHFIWRIMHNILPFGTNLSKRNMTPSACPFCNCQNETERHVFYECHYARKIWPQLGLVYLWNHSASTSFLSMITWLLQYEKEQTTSLFFIALWLIWKARCTMYFDQRYTDPTRIVSMANALLQEVHKNAENAVRGPPIPTKWCKSFTGTVSINVDASVTQDGRTSFGVLIRDSNAGILAAMSGPSQSHVSVEHAELLALLKGLLLAHEMNLKKVQLITDSMLAHSRIISAEKDCSLLSPLVQQIRKVVCEFDEVLHGFVRREGNKPAHLLAKLGLSMSCNLNWGTMPPYDVLLAVTTDSVVSNE